MFSLFFFFNDTATTEIYTLSLHDALPIYHGGGGADGIRSTGHGSQQTSTAFRSEEHTSELQSLRHLVCRLLLEKKKTKKKQIHINQEQKKVKAITINSSASQHHITAIRLD